MTRDNNKNVTQITSPNNRKIYLTYDASNRITQAQDDLNRTVIYQYAPISNLTTCILPGTTTPVGCATTAGGGLLRVTDPLGNVETYNYDLTNDANNIVSVVDKRGNTTVTNQFDINDRVTRQTYADTTFRTFAYTTNVNNMVTQIDVTDPRGMVRRTVFNASGYPTSVTYGQGTALAQTVTYNLSSNNLVNSMTDVLGRVTAYGYDTLGFVTSTTRLSGTPLAVTTSRVLEPTFRLPTQITGPNGNVTNIQRDPLGNPLVVTDPLGSGHTVTRTFDTKGRVLTIKDALNHTTTYTYTAHGDVNTVTDALGRTTTYFHDAAGRLTFVRDALGNASALTHDALDRLLSVTDGNGNAASRTYDANGNVLTEVDQNANPRSYAYDAMSRVSTMTDALNKVETRLYEPGGERSRVTDRKGQVSGFTYDILGRLTQTGFGATVAAPTAYTSTVSNTWDAGNRITSVVDTVGGTINRQFDNLDRMTQETTAQGVTTYTYDAGSRRTSLAVTGLPTITYGWDAADRLLSVTQAAGATNGNVVQTTTYGNDIANRRTTLTLPNGVVTAYGYDNADQLTSLTYTAPGNVSLGNLTYGYDAAGQRTNIGGTLASSSLPLALAGVTVNANNQITAAGGATFSYDFNGNMLNDGTNTLTWNARNQLQSAAGGGVTAAFKYDGAGRRIEKTINGVYRFSYLFDGLNLLQEKVDPGSGSTVRATMVPGLGIDEQLLRMGPTGPVTSVLTDALGSTMLETSNAATVTASYQYDPHGVPTMTGTSTNSQQYTGRENDGTGLMYYRARYYHPTLGRFVSEDPIGWAGGINTYAYAGNNPLINSDPLGLWTVSLGGFGSAIGGIGGSFGYGGYVGKANGRWAYGGYVNSGVGAGNNLSAGIEFGIFKGDTNTFSGHTTEIGGGFGFGAEGLGGAVVFNLCREPIGMTFTFGPSFPGASYSVTSSVTGLVGKTNGTGSTASCKPCDSQ